MCILEKPCKILACIKLHGQDVGHGAAAHRGTGEPSCTEG
jgi:hypothetical protein